MQAAPENAEAKSPVTFWQATGFWLKLGFISFGGPAGQIAIMHQELVERRKWISEKRFMHALNYCMLLPGPEAQQLATYMGWLMHRSLGGITAGLLFVLPSLVILVLLSWAYIALGNLLLISGIFYGIKPAVCAIVLQAAHRIGSRTLKNPMLWMISGCAFLAIFIFHLPFPLIVLIAALAGMVGGRVAPNKFQLGHGGAAAASSEDRSDNLSENLPDNPQTRLAHTRFRWSRTVVIIGIAALLWLGPVVAMTAMFGWSHTLTQMAWFFTKAALLTFGGAYAVLPYVYQGAVMHYAWLTPTQMIDGLALGESTPGPLIMVVAFVGFVGAYTLQTFGPELQFVAGAFAAAWVCWFTFLPSFVFILLGGPLVESTHNRVSFTAPLTAITAAVVGVIVNLALFFAYHVLWPSGFAGAFEWPALVIALLSLVALLKFGRKVTEVIAVAALAGLVLALI